MSQHDMNLADQAGSAFRADLNNALAALVGNSSGATEPATMFAYMFWADTTSGRLKQRNAANSAWLDRGPLAGVYATFGELVKFAAGSDIASGATVDLGNATGNSLAVTHSSGTTAISSLGGTALQKGTEITTIFSISGGTLSLTHHATNLILAGGADITLATGDTIRWRKMHDSNAEWKMVGGVRADGTAWVVGSTSSFPSGTLMLFQQTSAPTGWTKQTTHNDKALRVVSGSASSGGTSAFSTVFGKTATDAHTLTSAQIPAHTHPQAADTTRDSVNSGAGNISNSIGGLLGGTTQSNTGGGSSHSHNMDIRVQYVDLIIASKD